MNFADYLQFMEAMTLSAEDLDFDVRNPSLILCSFKHDGKEYKVKMSRGFEQGVDYVWGVYFEGPRGTRTTNTSGTSSTAVYNKLLSCVQKLFKTEKVNGLKFTPAEEGMAIPYDLFYRSFLRPNPPRGAGFLMVSPYLYLSKDKVREVDFVPNVMPAYKMQMAKIELVKVEKAIGRIYDRINSGTGFATDRRTLSDLEAKKNLIVNKFSKTERDYSDSVFERRDRREDARIAAERESNRIRQEEARIRQEEAREQERVRAAKTENIKSFSGKILVMGGSLPYSELVRSEVRNILVSSPWISINAGDEDSRGQLVIMMSTIKNGKIRKSSRSVDFEEANYIVSNFVEMGVKEQLRLAKRIYSDLINSPESSDPQKMSDVVEKLPKDLRVQIANIGDFTRGFEKTKKVVKGAVKDIAKAAKDSFKDIANVPVDTYRYWSGKQDPEEVRARGRNPDDIW